MAPCSQHQHPCPPSTCSQRQPQQTALLLTNTSRRFNNSNNNNHNNSNNNNNHSSSDTSKHSNRGIISNSSHSRGISNRPGRVLQQHPPQEAPCTLLPQHHRLPPQHPTPLQRPTPQLQHWLPPRLAQALALALLLLGAVLSLPCTLRRCRRWQQPVLVVRVRQERQPHSLVFPTLPSHRLGRYCHRYSCAATCLAACICICFCFCMHAGRHTCLCVVSAATRRATHRDRYTQTQTHTHVCAHVLVVLLSYAVGAAGRPRSSANRLSPDSQRRG